MASKHGLSDPQPWHWHALCSSLFALQLREFGGAKICATDRWQLCLGYTEAKRCYTFMVQASKQHWKDRKMFEFLLCVYFNPVPFKIRRDICPGAPRAQMWAQSLQPHIPRPVGQARTAVPDATFRKGLARALGGKNGIF